MITRAMCTRKEETLTGWMVTMQQVTANGANDGEPFTIRADSEEEFSEFAVHKFHKVEITCARKLK